MVRSHVALGNAHQGDWGWALIERRNSWFWLGLTPSLFVGIVALLAPSDVLDRIPAARMWAELLASVIPSMRSYIDHSQFPQVAGLTFLLAWAFFPFQFIFVLFSFIRHTDVFEVVSRANKLGLTRRRLLVMSGGLAIISAWALFFLARDPGIVGPYGVGVSRVGLSFLGAFQFWFTAFCFSAFFVIALKTNRGDFQ
jgi:hypothetical protein